MMGGWPCFIPRYQDSREKERYECNPKTSYCHLSSGFIPLGKIALALKITADDWHRAGYRDTDRLDAMLGRHFKMLTQRLEGHLSFAILLISEMGLSIWRISIVVLDFTWIKINCEIDFKNIRKILLSSYITTRQITAWTAWWKYEI